MWVGFFNRKGRGAKFFTAKARRTRRGWAGFCGGLRGGGWVFVRGSGAGAVARGLPGAGSDADVFVPQGGFVGDEALHEGDAAGIVGEGELDAVGAEEVFLSLEGDIFADHHAGDLVEQDGAGAHGARGQGGVEGAFGVDGGGQAAGVFEGVHLAVEDGAALLDAAVVAPANDLSLMDEDRADGDAAFGQSLFGFGDGGIQKRVHGGGSGV